MVILCFVLFLVSCDRNHPPVISRINCTPETRSAGTLFTLVAMASDEDENTLQYTWSADGGLFKDSVNQYQVTWRSPLDGNGKTFTIKVMVSDGKSESVLNFPISLSEPVFGQVTGYAYFNNCTVPVPGLTVSLDDKSAITDSAGHFRVADIPAGNYLLTATRADFNPASLQVNVVAFANVKVTISMASELYTTNVYGFVRDQDSLPVADAKVVMLNPDQSESKLIAYTNASGYYLLWYVPVGHRIIIVRKAATADFGFEQVTLDMHITGSGFHQDIEMANFNLKGVFIDSRDQHRYIFKIIGTQTWMAENLAWLPAVYPSSEGSDNSKYYYIMGYEGFAVNEARAGANYSNFGVLYNWQAAMEGCPPGWRLPGDVEWEILESYLGLNAAFHLKSISGWTNGRNGDNSSGFSALPGGERIDNIGFTGPGSISHFWSSTLATGFGAWTRALYYSDDELYRFANYKKSGYSVRCLKR